LANYIFLRASSILLIISNKNFFIYVKSFDLSLKIENEVSNLCSFERNSLNRKELRCLCHFFLRCFFRHPIFCWEQSAGDNCG